MNTQPDAQSELRHLLHEACPERTQEIDEILARYHVRFIYTDEASMAFGVRKFPTHAEIYCPKWTSPSLLAHTRAYLAVYDAASEASQTRPIVPISAQQALRRAHTLLDWADRLDTAKPEDRETIFNSWPTHEPEPFAGADHDDSLKLAEDLIWMAIAAILLHELGHLEKGHCNKEHDGKKGAEIVPLERDADEWARRFLMDKWEVYCASEYPDRAEAVDLVKTKRLLGPIIGFLYLVRHEQLNGSSDEHPRSYKRLIACLDDYVAEDHDHLAWAIIQSVFWVHLKRAKPNAQPGEYKTHRECAKALACALGSV